MSEHIADPTAPRPRPHHYMNADGTCHAGDIFEAGTGFVALYSAEELVRIVNAERDEAYRDGYAAALSKPEIDKVRAAALRDAADDWAGGEWRAVNFNRAGRNEHPGMRQARWMRERAASIESAHRATTPPTDTASAAGGGDA